MKKDKRSEEERRKLAAKIKAFRLELGLSINDMARRLGISRGGYHYYENGDRYPSTAILRRLLEEYDISLNWLLFDRGPRTCGEAIELERLRGEAARCKAEHDGPTIKEQADLIREQQEKLAQLLPIAELLNYHQQAEGSFPAAGQLKPEILKLVNAMHSGSRVYHEIMLHYEKVKDEK